MSEKNVATMNITLEDAKSEAYATVGEATAGAVAAVAAISIISDAVKEAATELLSSRIVELAEMGITRAKEYVTSGELAEHWELIINTIKPFLDLILSLI